MNTTCQENNFIDEKRFCFNPSSLASKIENILRNERPKNTERTTIDIAIDVGKHFQAFIEVYFLDHKKEELSYYFQTIMEESPTSFQQKSGELDNWQANRLFNAISVRVGQTPKIEPPRRTCVKAHWEW